MSTAEASPKRICQVCGHANSGLSLFCAECGSVLTMNPETGQKTPSAIVRETDIQETQAFSPTPVNPDDERWSAAATTGHDSSATAPYLPAARVPAASSDLGAMETATSAPAISYSSAGMDTSTNLATEDEPPESLRGFFFGVVAVILILAVAAVYSWTIIPNGSLRDTIQSWIDSIPV